MSTINLAFNLELNDDLSEEALASITSALIMDLSKDSFKTVAKVIAEQGIHNGTTATVNIKALDDLETAKDGARAMLEALAAHYEDRAGVHDAAVLAALPTTTSDPDALEDVHMEAGVAGGYRAAALYARDVIDAL
jgi:hypothetical protein